RLFVELEPERLLAVLLDHEVIARRRAAEQVGERGAQELTRRLRARFVRTAFLVTGGCRIVVVRLGARGDRERDDEKGPLHWAKYSRDETTARTSGRTSGSVASSVGTKCSSSTVF